MRPPSSDITHLLNAWCKGDQYALEQLAPLVESELRRLARAYLSKELAGRTLQPADLVNEVYLRLIEWNSVRWQNRARFYAVAAKMIRRVLVNQATAPLSQTRGGRGCHSRLARASGGEARPSIDAIALVEALKSLARFDERKSHVVEAAVLRRSQRRRDSRSSGDLRAHRPA